MEQQHYTCPMHPEIMQDKPGDCPKCGMTLVAMNMADAVKPSHEIIKQNAVDTDSEHTLQKYTCPMHPHIMKDAPGKCPLCGMKLEPVASIGSDTAHGKHNKHSGMIADFKKRFYVVLALTIPIMLLSEMIQHWLNLNINFEGSKYVLLLLSSVVFFYGGWPFLKGLVDEARAKNPGMMFLIGFAITIAYAYSVAVVFGLKGMDFFWELATLILIMLLGHWIEMRSVAGASRELELLVQLMPAEAHKLNGEQVEEVNRLFKRRRYHNDKAR